MYLGCGCPLESLLGETTDIKFLSICIHHYDITDALRVISACMGSFTLKEDVLIWHYSNVPHNDMVNACVKNT